MSRQFPEHRGVLIKPGNSPRILRAPSTSLALTCPLSENLRGHPGDELQIVHLLELGALLAVPVTDLALGFQKRQPLQGEHRPEHVLPHPLGLWLRLGQDQAVDVEAGVRPGENSHGPLGTQQLPADQEPEDVAGKDLLQPRVVGPIRSD
jgi:hypothetical protein